MFLVTKLAKGGDLVSYLDAMKKSKLGEEQARSIFYQLSRAVKEVHDQGLIHRDLKHMNVLLSNTSSNPKVKLADFGLCAKLREGRDHTKDGQCVGTACYMAPEVILC